ncbi:MAG: hypothetical protein JW829_01160 [Pirellulales bacterium]|nr:hypothetical protein [Pirellulales bacterium]
MAMCSVFSLRPMIALAIAVSASTLIAQEGPIPSPPVVHFTRQPARVGEQMAQDMQFRLAMETTVHRDGQPIASESTELIRTQRRLITARQIEKGLTICAEVEFKKADQTLREGDQVAKTLPQPVAGKTYLVSRQGNTLTITDLMGRIPPMEEYEVVMQSMEAIGRPNPLAEFLAGRNVAIGQTLSLPKEIAGSLLGDVGQEGEVTRFEITLQKILTTSTSRPDMAPSHPGLAQNANAVFKIQIEARSPGQVQMGMLIEGTLLVEIKTCRTVQANLAGPVGMTQTSGPASARSFMSGRGRIEIVSSSQYVSQ